MMDDPRLKISLDIGKDGDYYDQILSMSQGVINKSFEQLHAKYESLRTINIKISDGLIRGEMNPPRITIPTQQDSLDQSKVYFHMSFKSGNMSNLSGRFNADMADWTIIIQCDMDRQSVPRKLKPGDSSSQTDVEREFLEKTFAVPGDYGIERLYVKLASANWNKVDGNSRVVNPRTKQKCSFKEWQDEVDDYNDKNEVSDDNVFYFTSIMAKWTRQMEKKGLTTLGFKITKPKSDDTPTFVPSSLLHETYPYYDNKGVSEGDVVEGGDHNCFLYLEKVGEHGGPGKAMLEWTANLAFPAQGDLPEVGGTFVLSRQLFLERFLLPKLQTVNKDSTIYVDKADVDRKGNWTFPNSWEGGPVDPTDAQDREFAFELQADGSAYQYKKASRKGGFINWKWHPSDPTRSNTREESTHTSETTVKMGWTPGSNAFNLSGSIHYSRELKKWIGNSESPEWTKEDNMWEWDFPVKITQDQGCLVFTISEQVIPGKPKSTISHSKDPNAAVDVENKGLDEKYKPIVDEALRSLSKRLNATFQHAGKFAYPGSGQLNFSCPKFSNNGCLFCDVSWKPLGEEEVIRVS